MKLEFSASVGFIHKESVNDARSYDRKKIDEFKYCGICYRVEC